MVSNILLGVINDLKEERGFKFLEPWMYSSNSLVAVVPIVRSGAIGSREYVVFEEVPPGTVSIVDTGELGKLEVASNYDKPVFIRGGSIVEGRTQPRAIRYGIVAEPHTKTLINVVCVNETRPIMPKASLEFRAYAPLELRDSIIEGEQHEVWRRIREFSYSLVSREAATPTTSTSLYLVDVVRDLERSRGEVVDVIKKFPIVENQVGVVIIDALEGVKVLEVFDHPDSWRAISKFVKEEFANVLTKASEELPFQVIPDLNRVKRAVSKFLDRAVRCSEYTAYRGKNSYTIILKGEEVIGEYTVLNNELIHLMLTRPRRRVEPEVIPRSALMRIIDRSTYDLVRETREGRVLRSLFMVLKALESEPLTWTELVRRVERLSPATISRRLREGLVQGLITKTVRDDGREVYYLTAKGKALLEALKREFPQ